MKKFTITIAFFIFLLSAVFLQAQVAITPDGSEADPSAMLDVQSTNKGVLFPRMTSEEIQSISNPANGLIVYCTTEDKLYVYVADEVAWKEIFLGNQTFPPYADISIGDGGSCENTIVNSSCIPGNELETWNYVTIQIDVINPGDYSIETNKVNGYSFSDSGFFASTGLQYVNLAGSGTPEKEQIDVFTATAFNGGGSCTFSVNVEDCVPFTDSRDGKSYNIINYNGKCWMRENLNYDQNTYGEDWCYDNNPANCDTYGRYYSWAALLQGDTSSNANPSGVQGVCPDGWHVPSKDEWYSFIMFLFYEPYFHCNWGDYQTAKAIASNTPDWEECTNNPMCSPGYHPVITNNSSLFSALPGGSFNGSFSDQGFFSFMWSCTTINGSFACCMGLNYCSLGWEHMSTIGYSDAIPVRCIKD